MKYIFIFLILVSLNSFAKELPSCSVEKSKDIEAISGLEKGKLTIGVKGNPCYEATVKLHIYSSNALVYEYIFKFKPHVSIHWEDLIEKDVENFINNQLENYNFINCSELPKIKQSGDLPYYENLLISEEKYNNLKKSNCRAFIHTYQHYEGNRIVVFPINGEKIIVVR